MPARSASAGPAGANGAPSSSIVPASGACAPASTFIKVLLPAPFSPTSAWISPRPTSRSTPSSAWLEPKRLVTPRIESSAASAAAVTSATGLRSEACRRLQTEQDADHRKVLIEVGPMNPLAHANQLPAVALLGGRLPETRIPVEGHSHFTSVCEHDDHALALEAESSRDG